MMEEDDGPEFCEPEVEVEAEEFADDEEEEDAEMRDSPVEAGVATATDYVDEETRILAAGLASQDEGELLAALEAMQKAVIGAAGEKVLIAYVLASPQCAELMKAWQAGPGAAPAVPVMLLLNYMFRHPLGKLGSSAAGSSVYQKDYSSADGREWHKKVMGVKLRLDKLARSVVRTHMKDIYSHLSSSQKSRQNSALLLLSGIVLRGRALAIEIATSFDFTLEALRKLGHPPKQGAQKVKVEGHRGILKQPTRVAFVEFAMSFLSVADPGLLRWILQKRPLWIGVLHGISKDDKWTIVRVLTLMQKVMSPSFMVPRGLQSVLFGDATLEQLARISSDDSLEEARELSHATLLSLCTDSSHGLCPETWDDGQTGKNGAYGGGQGRLLRLMLRLRVTEVDRHRDLLLATSRARPKLATSYLASIPLSLEPRVSPAWFNAMSLVSQLIPIASQPPSFSSIAAQSRLPPPVDGPLIQNILLSMLPGFSRVALNRGLLHRDFMVKHACLRVLLEALLSLQRVISAVGAVASVEPAGEYVEIGSHGKTHDQNVEFFSGPVALVKSESEGDSYKQEWIKLSQSIQDIMRASLPDPNTLMAILSSLKVSQGLGRKGTPSESRTPSKMRKRKHLQSEIETQELQNSVSDKYEYDVTIMQLWGAAILDESGQREDMEGLLHAKVVQVLAAYQTALPIAMADTGFDAFKLLPDDPTSLSATQKKSLSALLWAATAGTASPMSEDWWSGKSLAGLGSACKKVKPLLVLMLVSETKEVRHEAGLILQRVMASTGAFDSNPKEILIWLHFLPQWKIEKFDVLDGFIGNINIVKSYGLHPGTLHATVLEFLSEAVSSVNQSIYNYFDLLHSILSNNTSLEGKEFPPLQSTALQGVTTTEFGPFVICILKNCIQVLRSMGRSAVERCTIALYVANAIDLLLRYQVTPQPLAIVVISLLSTENELLAHQQLKGPEWVALLILLKRAQLYILNDDSDNLRTFSASSTASLARDYQAGKLAEVLKYCQESQESAVEAKLAVLIPTLVCVSVRELVDSFPLLMKVCLEDLEGDLSVLVTILGIHQDVLCEVSIAWPEVFTGAVELAAHAKDTSEDSWNVETWNGQQGSSGAEVFGLCVLLLLTPFSVLFSAATYSRQGLLFASIPFSDLLQASLRRLHYENWACMVRFILCGIKHIATLSLEGSDIGSPVQICFSLLRSIALPVEQSPTGIFPSNSVLGSSQVMQAYEPMIIDLLDHPEILNMFLQSGQKGGTSSVPCPYVSDLRRDKNDENICDTSLRRVLASAATNTHPIDSHILSLLTQLLEISQTLVQWASSFSDAGRLLEFCKKVRCGCKPFMIKAIDTFQLEVDERSQNGVAASPALFSVSVLISYADPSLLFSSFQSLLSRKALKVKNSKQVVAPHVLGLHFVTVFVDSLSGDAPKFAAQREFRSWPQYGLSKRNLDVLSLYDLYETVIGLVTGNPSVVADLCLLSFLRAPNLKPSHWPFVDNMFRLFKESDPALAHSTPLEVLRHCVSHPNRVTGNIVMLLVRTSPVHLSEFGRLLALGTAKRWTSNLSSTSLEFAAMFLTHHVGIQKTELAWSDQDLLYLLPAAQIYVASESKKVGVEWNMVAGHIAAVYAKFLAEQMKDWDKIVQELITNDRVQDLNLQLRSSQSDEHMHIALLNCYNCSPLGQMANMLHTCQILHPLSLKAQNGVLHSLLPKYSISLVHQNMFLYAGADFGNSVFEAVAKTYTVGKILFSGCKLQAEETQLLQNKEVPEVGEQLLAKDPTSLKHYSALLKFLSCLVTTLDMLYKTKVILGQKKMDQSVSGVGSELLKAQLVNFLEEILLVQITDIAKELAMFPMDPSKYLPLFRYCMTTLLGYRYGENSAMKASRYLTFVLFQGLGTFKSTDQNSFDVDVLELLMAHSKFLPSLLVADSKKMDIPHISGKHAGKGTALNSLSSILSLVGSPLISIPNRGSKIPGKESTAEGLKQPVASYVIQGSSSSATKEEENKDNGSLDVVNRLELVKLLRVLLGVRLKVSTHGMPEVQSVPLDEVLSILLAAYGGTMSAVDREIFLLMQEMESYGGLGFSGLSGLDYLWGEAALKRRRAQAEQVKINISDELEGNDELRKQTFKEDLLIDPRRCGLTVLFFPAKSQFRGVGIGQLDLESQYKGNTEGVGEHSSGANDGGLRAAAYDPAFLLPFALHGLSVGCISAEEFVRLGLLAVAFASLSSAEESMRKAGYEILAKYYSVLEDGPSFKGRLQIRLLMTCVKNAVTEPWQRLAAVLAVFAAEASCILMHPENHHYMIINRFLLRAPSLDLESIPLFQVMFGSGSLQYRSDRLWMLRLLAAGLQSSLDANVYRRKFVLELLMSFHDSTMADTFPRKWVLQVLFQAAAVRSCAQYLVEHTGCLSWLASVAVNAIDGDLGFEDKEGSGQIACLALQVIHRIRGWGSVQRYFLMDCLEELSKVGHMFFQLLARNPMPQYLSMFRRSTISILLALVRISNKRRKHQTQFTLSWGALLEALRWVGLESPGAIQLSDPLMEDAVLALQLLLHTAPPTVCSKEDKQGLLKAVNWALSVALQLEMDSAEGSGLQSINSYLHLKTGLRGRESLSEKLMRWLAASVVRGHLPKGERKMELGENFVSCFSFIDGFRNSLSDERDLSEVENNEKLASIFLKLECHVSEKADGISLIPVVAAVTVLTHLTNAFISTGDLAVQMAQQRILSILEVLLMELPCPVETSSSWQWSFHSPWVVQNPDNISVEDTGQAQYESEICWTVLILLQQLLSRRPAQYPTHLSQWEYCLAQKPRWEGDFESTFIRKNVCIKFGELKEKLRDALSGIPGFSSGDKSQNKSL